MGKVTNIESFKMCLPESLDRFGNMLREYSIVVDPNIPEVQYDVCRVQMEAREEVEVQLKEMKAHGIITPYMEQTSLVSSLTYATNQQSPSDLS